MSKENGYVVIDVGALVPTATAVEFNANSNIMSLTNESTATIYIGTTSAVTSADGYPLRDAESAMIKGSVYLVMATGETGDLRYAQLGVI